MKFGSMLPAAFFEKPVDAVLVVCPKCQRRGSGSGTIGALVVATNRYTKNEKVRLISYPREKGGRYAKDEGPTTWDLPNEASQFGVQCRHGRRTVDAAALLAELDKFRRFGPRVITSTAQPD